MTTHGHTLFDTAIGACGLAWGPHGITGAQLPEASEAAASTRLRRRFPGSVATAPTPAIADAVARIQALLAGEAADLDPIELDLGPVPAFNRKVYAVARAIPPGQTLTYGEVAARLGNPALAREVGQTLGRNPFPIIVPCHRVLGAGGKLVGFSAPGGTDTKRRLLEIEGARIGPALPLFDLFAN
jgi:methylated-DNA-[protein]-cysteine S-methyltransferase